MIILGIDPGTASVGFGLIKMNRGLELVDYGCIHTTTRLKTEERLAKIYQEVFQLIKKYKPSAVAVEDLFFFKNQKTVIKVSQARGVILLAIARSKTRLLEFTPLQVKQAVACYGRADKKQVQQMVQAILNLKKIPKPDDAADALAIAICCANTIK